MLTRTILPVKVATTQNWTSSVDSHQTTADGLPHRQSCHTEFIYLCQIKFDSLSSNSDVVTTAWCATIVLLVLQSEPKLPFLG